MRKKWKEDCFIRDDGSVVVPSTKTERQLVARTALVIRLAILKAKGAVIMRDGEPVARNCRCVLRPVVREDDS